jgi:hypothetical protein
MYYYIYKTTNLLNGKYYIGMHKTTNLNDGYLGSGNLLKRAIKKYGKDNFIKEILLFCESLDELRSNEQQYVTEQVTSDPNSYNLKLGGQGGFTDEMRQTSYNTFRNRLDNDPEFAKRISENNKIKAAKREGWREANSILMKQRYNDPEFVAKQRAGSKIGYQKTFALKQQRLSEGWVWMKDPNNKYRSKMIPPTDIEQYLTEGWKIRGG